MKYCAKYILYIYEMWCRKIYEILCRQLLNIIQKNIEYSPEKIQNIVTFWNIVQKNYKIAYSTEHFEVQCRKVLRLLKIYIKCGAEKYIKYCAEKILNIMQTIMKYCTEIIFSIMTKNIEYCAEKCFYIVQTI